MAAGNYIPMNVDLDDARTCQNDIAELVQWARQMKALRIFRQRDKIAKMCTDNNTSSAANFAYMADQYGITEATVGGAASTAKAKALFDEINAVCGAIEASGIDEAAFQLEALTQA